jgi:hypothetical protein
MAAIGLAGAVRAMADPVDLSVVDRDSGQALRIWRHHGRLFVAGSPGARYSLRVANDTGGRVLVVMSVDGVNILTGETAGYDQRGYVFNPYQSYDVSGWRKSTTEVAAFTFAPLSQSYAARTGRAAEVGVIGMAVFTERAPPAYVAPPAPRPEWRDDPQNRALGGADAKDLRRAPAPPPAPIAPAPPSVPILAAPSSSAGRMLERPREAQEERLGTAHGAREWSAASLTSFVRASPWPQCVRQIEYDTYDHLVARGVIPTRRRGDHRLRPFPARADGADYVPDPPEA